LLTDPSGIKIEVSDDKKMRAMIFRGPSRPLSLEDVPIPRAGAGQIVVRIEACAVCRTDLHVVDGELPDPKVPLIPGHEIVGSVVETGPEVDDLQVGQRIGIPWMGWTCGQCSYCRSGLENLCDHARFTGYTIDGGYAEYASADRRFAIPIPASYESAEAAPLLCAGLIGFRSLRKAGDARSLGLYGFGAAAHIIAQVAIHEGRKVYAFTRPGDESGQEFARKVGAVWAGGSDVRPPELLDAAIIFAPVGSLVPAALRAVRKGGTVVCGGIHMSDVPAFPYEILWGERKLVSVANLTQKDGEEFMRIAQQVPVRSTIERFPLEAANEALSRLRDGKITGAAVLDPGSGGRRSGMVD
jgi:propanol-preferring alcohol dehydrogenase